jgi:hypothetical protein
VRVQSPDAKTNYRNLLGGQLARWWTEEAVGRLQHKFAMPMPALAQDGGEAVNELTSLMPNEDFEKIAKEFFLALKFCGLRPQLCLAQESRTTGLGRTCTTS